MKKQKIVKKSKIPSYVYIVPLVFLGVFVILLCIYFEQTKPTIENRKTDVGKIPEDVKKVIQHAPQLRQSSITVPILMYHYIEYVKDKRDTTRVALNVTPDILEKQLQTMQEAGYTFMTAKEVAEVLDNNRVLPLKPIVLTFDDGHDDFPLNALPLLKKYHIHATAYIITGFLNKPDFMSYGQLDEVAASGLVELGAHTVHHIALKGKLAPIVQNEIVGSKKFLEERYHTPIVSFAYPSGSFDVQAIEQTKAAGFTNAVSTIPGEIDSNTNRYFLYRLRPGNRTGHALLSFIEEDAKLKQVAKK